MAAVTMPRRAVTSRASHGHEVPGHWLLVTAVLAWNQGLATKIGTLVQQISQ